jgi:hypothetical protein
MIALAGAMFGVLGLALMAYFEIRKTRMKKDGSRGNVKP